MPQATGRPAGQWHEPVAPLQPPPGKQQIAPHASGWSAPQQTPPEQTCPIAQYPVPHATPWGPPRATCAPVATHEKPPLPMVPLQAKPSLQHGPAALQAPEKPAPQTGVRAGTPHWPVAAERHEVPLGQHTLPQLVPFAQKRPTGWEATQLEPLQVVPLGQQRPPQRGEPSEQTSGTGA